MEMVELLPGAVDGASADADHVRRTLQGEGAAFEQIVGAYQPRIFSFLHQMTRHRQDAEDLTQQTFLKAFQSLARFQPDRPLINWLLMIARNSALNHFRSVRAWEPVPETLPTCELSPSGAAEETDERGMLWGRVRASLPQRQFEVLWLRFGEELSVKETAQVMGFTQTHVKILAFRARHALLKGNLRS